MEKGRKICFFFNLTTRHFTSFCILVYECHELFTRFGTKGRLIQALISYGLFQTVAAMIDLKASHFHKFF